MHAGVKPWLIVLADPLVGERSDHELIEGARLSDELMRLFPQGIEGSWSLYNREVEAGTEIDKAEAPHITLSCNDLVILVRFPGTPNFWIQLAITALLSFASRLLTPSPRRPRATEEEQRESGNNQLAGQTNVLRAGARVPEILGRVRSWPDLLTYAVEEWPELAGHRQNIVQHFVIGVGAYQIEDKRLGDTPVGAVIGTSSVDYPPGTTVPAMQVLKQSPSVAEISLNDTASGAIATGVTFTASTKTVSSPTDPLSLFAGGFVTFDDTASNDGTFFVVSVAAGGPPYVYTLDGDVADEPSVTPSYVVWPSLITLSGVNATMRYGGVLNRIKIDASTTFIFSNGDGYYMQTSAGNFHGRISAVNYTVVSGTVTAVILDVVDMYGAAANWPSAAAIFISVANFYKKPLGVTLARRAVRSAEGPELLTEDPSFTGWFTAPIADPDEVWLDFSFPQGLVKYSSGNRTSVTIAVEVEFKRPVASAAQATASLTFGGSSATPQRSTRRFAINQSVDPSAPENLQYVTLPAGEFVEVRVRRATPLFVETATVQYVDDFRWSMLRSEVLLPARVYPDVHIIRLQITNTNSAVALGESSFNVVATRILPTWTGSAWSAPAASRKWADSFVARCKALDGANRSDAEIDIAGIYALQAQLDALEPTDSSHPQGQISMTLDQQQDIDSELTQIADVVRALVYRVGKKIYAARDQAQATAIALFNGRSKSAEGESIAVRMKSEDENDAVLVQWVDELAGWKVREYQYPEGGTPSNILRAAALSANWAQAYRRARFEWNRLRYRREQLSVAVTEEGRICRPGDVVHITDDIANLALAAGEVIYVSALVLTLDRDVSFAAPGTYTILLRDVAGVDVAAVPCVAVAGSPNRVQLSRAATVTIKGRDEALGTLYSFYNDANVTARKWLLTAVEAHGPYVQLSAQNYSPRVYEGDAVTLPARPALGT